MHVMTSSTAALHQQIKVYLGVLATPPPPPGGGRLLTPAVPFLRVRVFR
jgi:hypothetical protein